MNVNKMIYKVSTNHLFILMIIVCNQLRLSV